MKNRAVYIVRIIMVAIVILFTSSRYWFRTIILHLGAGLRYGCIRLFQPKRKVSYKYIRYGPDDFSVMDHADNNFANGFLGEVVLAIILILIVN